MTVMLRAKLDVTITGSVGAAMLSMAAQVIGGLDSHNSTIVEPNLNNKP